MHKTANGVFVDVAQKYLPGRSLLTKCHTLARYMRKCNFIYNSKKIMAFLASIFTKFTSARKNYMQVSHNEFRKNKCVTYKNNFNNAFK